MDVRGSRLCRYQYLPAWHANSLPTEIGFGAGAGILMPAVLDESG